MCRRKTQQRQSCTAVVPDRRSRLKPPAPTVSKHWVSVVFRKS